MSATRLRILFMAESVTLAHVARPMVLARSLDPRRFTVGLGTDGRFAALFEDLPAWRHPIRCLSPETFLDRLAKGVPLFDAEELAEQVREDLKVIEAFQPDLVVGDLRLSLSVSARLARVPYATITNAYWSPHAKLRLRVPEVALTRALGVTAAQAVFAAVRPLVFRQHSAPMNRLRRRHGLPGLGHDVRRVYTDADQVLLADPPGLVPMDTQPPNHHFIGPVLWSPRVTPPPWWDRLPTGKPIVYVTLGSSGRADLLPRVLDALADTPTTVVAATAGRFDGFPVPANAQVVAFLPGDLAAARAALVVCNGGSPTTHQALAAGKPVLGLPSNMDQLLNMESVVREGAGLELRPSRASDSALRSAVTRLLADNSFTRSARALSKLFLTAADGEASFPALAARWTRHRRDASGSTSKDVLSYELPVAQPGLPH